MCRSVIPSVGIAFLLLVGCVSQTTNVTHVNSPRYRAVSGCTFVTRCPLFVVEDRGEGRKYLVAPDPQDLPYAVTNFMGKEIKIVFGRNSYITDVLAKETMFRIDRIENIAGMEMSRDVLYATILTGRHADETLEVERLFLPSDSSMMQILPRPAWVIPLAASDERAP